MKPIPSLSITAICFYGYIAAWLPLPFFINYVLPVLWSISWLAAFGASWFLVGLGYLAARLSLEVFKLHKAQIAENTNSETPERNKHEAT